jgi:hypothetical protein
MCSWHSLPAPFKQAKIKGAVDIAALKSSYLQQPSDSRLTEDKAHTPDQREGSSCFSKLGMQNPMVSSMWY